jgi:hypothetical protein
MIIGVFCDARYLQCVGGLRRTLLLGLCILPLRFRKAYSVGEFLQLVRRTVLRLCDSHLASQLGDLFASCRSHYLGLFREKNGLNLHRTDCRNDGKQIARLEFLHTLTRKLLGELQAVPLLCRPLKLLHTLFCRGLLSTPNTAFHCKKSANFLYPPSPKNDLCRFVYNVFAFQSPLRLLKCQTPADSHPRGELCFSIVA